MLIKKEISTSYIGYVDKDLAETLEELHDYMATEYADYYFDEVIEESNDGWTIKFTYIHPHREGWDD